MAVALGLSIDTAGLFAPLGMELHMEKNIPKMNSITVQITTGGGDKSVKGAVPHVAIWDDDGNRIGQYHPNKKDKIGAESSKQISIEATQHGLHQDVAADPYYVMLSNQNDDAVCISAVGVGNSQVSSVFYGDVGYKCGQSWFLSDSRIGSDFRKPRCVWLDGNHSNNINAKALSFHLNDMAPNPDKIQEYTEMLDTLCKSSPRFSFWGNLLPDGIPPFFTPKLEYNVDSSGEGEGADKDPKRVIDSPGQYNKAVYLHQDEKTKRAERQELAQKRKGRSCNHDPGHLIITDHPEDDVREVCQHPNSYGWDIVSTVQKVFCDMEDKQLYPLCEKHKIKEGCFDLEQRKIITNHVGHHIDHYASHQARDVAVPQKNYTSQEHWKK